MKYIKYVVGSILLIVLTLAVGNLWLGHTEQALGNASDFSKVYMTKGGGSPTQTAMATTTEGVSYLATTATASTTFPFSTNNADLVTLDILHVASSSSSNLLTSVQISNDSLPCDTDQTRCNWFSPAVLIQPALFYSQTAAGSSTVLIAPAATTSQLYTYTASQLGTSTVSLQFSTVGAKFMRFNFGTIGAPAAIWAEANLKRQRP